MISGKQDENKTYTYLLQTDTNQVQTYYISDLNFVNYTPVKFLPDSVTTASMYSVTGVDFTYGDIQDSFTMNMTDRILEMNGQEIDIKKTDTSTAFQNFYNSFSVLIFTDTDVEATPDNSEPLLTAVYHVTDGTDIKIDFVDAGNDKCYIFKDDVYTGGIVDMTRLTGKNSVQSFYNSFCEYAGIVQTVRSQPTIE